MPVPAPAGDTGPGQMNDHVLAFEAGRTQIQVASVPADPHYGVPAGLKISGRGRADKTARSCYRNTHKIIVTNLE